MSYLIHKRSQGLLTELYFATPVGHDNSNLMHPAIKCMKLLDISYDFLCSLELWVCEDSGRGLAPSGHTMALTMDMWEHKSAFIIVLPCQ